MKIYFKILFAILLISSFTTAQEFQGSFDLIAAQFYPNGNERSDTVSYYFGIEKTAMIIHAQRNQPDLRMIFNQQDSTIINLFEMNGKKRGYILPMDEEHWPGMPHALRSFGTGPRTELNYTGEEKEIGGYQCRGVTAESEYYSALMWVSEDIPLSMTRVLSYQSVGKGKSKKEIEMFDEFGIEGLPLEMNLTSKKGKADVIIRVVNIKETFDENVFSTEGHELSKVE
jgi:hypothetical protein